eukprot:1861163-Amphidinium_carterae.2
MVLPCVLERSELERLKTTHEDTVICMRHFDSEWDEAQEISPFGFESVERPGAPVAGQIADDVEPDCVDLLEVTSFIRTDSAVWDVASPTWVEPIAVATLESIIQRRNPGSPEIGAKQKGLALSEEERLAI